MRPFQDTVAQLWQRGEFFSPAAPVAIARAPGRLDLMGGNDDYTGGLVFEATIREATWAAAQLRPDRRVLVRNETAQAQGWQGLVERQLSDLAAADDVRAWAGRSAGTRWTAYVLGNLHYLVKHYRDRITSGIQIYLDSDVPLNKGVSSSAAVEVSVMKAAAHAYGIELAGLELAEACQWVENVIAQSACGIMDQITSVLGDEGHILPLVCQPCIPEDLVRLPDAVQCWAIDSGVSHEVSGLEYEAARAAAFMGYKMICDWEGLPVTRDTSRQIPRYTDPRWNGYLANLARSVFHERYERRLPEQMTGADFLRQAGPHVDPYTAVHDDVTYAIRANTRYAVEENQRVQLFAQLARSPTSAHSERTLALMGDLMYQSHYAYSECGLGAQRTDQLIALAREEGPGRGILGAKITGGGAGGTVAILGQTGAEDALERIINRYADATGQPPYVFAGSSPGADRFGIVVLRP
ncbi:MAG: hypothetical protein A2W31_03160 [Planctomycetes bacterium RBG_16_64_10]|nr:MAG: hypothetical protein A2W31_03160 [Planctomycetes bacterium RBG_16_64_10]